MPGESASPGVRDHIRQKLPYVFEDLGEHSVKNIARPIRVYLLRSDERISDEPSSDEGPAAPAPPANEASELPADPHAVEVVFWESIKPSTQTADYEAYLEQYPAGDFAALARARLEEIASAGGEVRDPKDREIELSFWECVRESDNPATLEA